MFDIGQDHFADAFSLLVRGDTDVVKFHNGTLSSELPFQYPGKPIPRKFFVVKGGTGDETVGHGLRIQWHVTGFVQKDLSKVGGCHGKPFLQESASWAACQTALNF